MEKQILTLQNEIHSNMLMDVIVIKLAAGEKHELYDEKNETAVLLFSGEMEIVWDDHRETVKRKDVFTDKPYCLHVCAGIKIELTAVKGTEMLVQKTLNDRVFDAVFYTPEVLEERILGGDQYQGTARRLIRDIFLYDNAPYSNMVLGEIVHYPGRWSSWPPHSHEQPEVYYYKFDRPQGFGVSIVGDTATIIREGDFTAIPGGVDHPQVSAPGYAMYYTWMIRHFDGNPWTDRNFAKEHVWMNEPDAKFWER